MDVLGQSLKVLGRSPALMHVRDSTLIVSDIHLGYEDSMAQQGVYLPRLQLKRAKMILDEGARAGARRLVIDGDLKHVFEKLTRGEKLEVVELVRHALELGIKDIVLVRGNHDTFVTPLLKEFGVDVVEDYLTLDGGILITHGHKLPDAIGSADAVVIGHEHPSLEISLAGSKVKLQVLLKAPMKSGGTLIVMPAIGIYQTGTSVGLDPSAYLSPITKEYAVLEEAVPIIIDREIGTVELPPLGSLLRLR